MFRTISFPNPARDGPTHYSRAKTLTVPVGYVEEHPEEVVWFNRSAWIPSYFEKLGNIWYYSSRILPLYTAQLKGAELGLPPMDGADVLVLGWGSTWAAIDASIQRSRRAG